MEVQGNEQDIVNDVEQTNEVVAESEQPDVAEQPEDRMTMERLREMALSDVEPEGNSDEKINESQAIEYEPNLTYKVKDQEKQFDERLIPALKDKESEEYIRDLVTKSEGLDSYKEKYSALESEAQSYYNQAAQLTAGFKALQEFRDNNDFNKLQQALGISKDQVVQWALGIAEEDALPPEQQEAIRKQREQEAKIEMYERQQREWEEQQHDQLLNSQVSELQQLAQTEKVRPLVEAMKDFQDNFYDRVIATGRYIYEMTGKEPAVSDVVNRVFEQNKYLIEKPQQMEQPQQQREKPKTLPRVGGSSTSRASQPKIRSLEQLKALADSI